MNSERLIRVLWVEDDYDYAKGFISNYCDDLEITHFGNWSEAKPVLERDFNEFDAIILDARCKLNDHDLDIAERFLINVFVEINAMMMKNSKNIPWYVLSGGDSQNISHLILDSRKDWDSDWGRAYYIKGTDEDALVERIKEYCYSHTPLELQIKTALFSDVFNAIADTGIGALEKYMMAMLKPLADVNLQYDPNAACSKARNILESIFVDMTMRGLLPEAIRRKNGSVVIEWCSIVLAGDLDEITPQKQPQLYNAYRTNALDCPLFGALPKIMSENIKIILKACANEGHAQSQQISRSRRYDYSSYEESVGHTPYLLRSFALQLCDFILWYASILKSL